MLRISTKICARFNLNKKFDFITMASNSLLALLIEKDQIECFYSIMSHMQKEILFIMNTCNATDDEMQTLNYFEH